MKNTKIKTIGIDFQIYREMPCCGTNTLFKIKAHKKEHYITCSFCMKHFKFHLEVGEKGIYFIVFNQYTLENPLKPHTIFSKPKSILKEKDEKPTLITNEIPKLDFFKQTESATNQFIEKMQYLGSYSIDSCSNPIKWNFK